MADAIIQEIKERLDIVEVIGSYLPLKRAGVNFRANCPFHNEKTPSFNVNSVRQIWHCFGCGEGGDVFTFVQKFEHLEFPEVMQQLADRAGVQLPERRPEDARHKDLRERLFRVNLFTAKFYSQLLRGKAGEVALEYLRSRGLTDATIDSWNIGYAPDDFQLLEKALLAKGAKKEDMVAAGVSAQSPRGTYDRFRGRITFPIFDFSGKVVGFSARILGNKDLAKYINSPESPVYSKGQVLFGLYQAKAAIRELDYAVVVEGQMDCIKAHQAGFTNTVATSGTALTHDQLRALSKLTRNLKLCFDADAAGQRAAKKAGSLALSLGFSVKVITVTGAKDPDELISQDPKLWQQAVASSVWFVDYFITQAEKDFTARSVEQGKFIQTEVLPLVALLPDPLERGHYSKLLAEQFGLDLRVLQSLAAPARVGSQESRQQPSSGVVEALGEVPVTEKYALGSLLYSPQLVTEWLGLGGSAADFSSPVVSQLVLAIAEGRADSVSLEPLAQEALFMVESEKTRGDGTEAAFIDQLQKSLISFRLTALKARQQQITADIRMAEGKDPSVLRELQRTFLKLSTDRLDLERKIDSL
jgi:DNA primase